MTDLFSDCSRLLHPGIDNYRKSHSPILAGIAAMAWGLLMLSHPLAIYVVWFVEMSWYGLALVALLHILFFAIFGRDVSTG